LANWLPGFSKYDIDSNLYEYASYRIKFLLNLVIFIKFYKKILCCTLAGPPKPPYIPPVRVYGPQYCL